MTQISGCLSEKSGSMRINTFPMKDLHNGRSPMSYEQHKDAPVSKCCFLNTFKLCCVGLYDISAQTSFDYRFSKPLDFSLF